MGGLLYSFSLMTILLCHEAGITCRHAVRSAASLPFFIPMPVTPIGTMGAVIVMDPRSGDRKALFDIGITGPLAGLIPTWSAASSACHSARCVRCRPGTDEFGEPLVFQWLARDPRTVSPGWAGYGPGTLALSILAHAGWVGLLITSLNLFPIGQLDGGHILYGLLRDRARPVAAPLLLRGDRGGVLLPDVLVAGHDFLLVLMGPAHPPTTNDNVPLGPWRTILGWLTLAFLPLGFTPTPLAQTPRPQPGQVEDLDVVWRGGALRHSRGFVRPAGGDCATR